MRRRLLALALALAGLGLGVRRSEGAQAAAHAPASPVATNVHQLMLVRASSWASAKGTLQRYERNASGPWRAVGDAITVNLGRNGLAWGRGLQQPIAAEPGPVKREGDGRSPAGAFEIERAFGEAESLPSGAHGFPYLHTSDSIYCVEDVGSKQYNRIIDLAEQPAKFWQRRSSMRRSDGLFRWGAIVRQNSPEPVIGAGSCVFLHIWRGLGQPTSGCTAMAPENIEAILRWLDPGRHPIIVQLPEPSYQHLREGWALP